MLLEYGLSHVHPGWHVTELAAPGYTRVYYVHGGTVTYHDEDGDTLLQKDHLYWFPTNRPYRMVQNDADRLRCAFLHLDVSPEVVPRLAALPVTDDPFLEPLLDALEQALSTRTESLIVPLADSVAAYGAYRRAVLPLSGSLAQVTGYIASHISETLDVPSLSRMAGYTRQHFIRLFKHNLGLTPHQYITSLRMKRAAELLKRGCTLSQAAEQTGYGDANTFGRAFRTHFGLTPGAWRQHSRPAP